MWISGLDDAEDSGIDLVPSVVINESLCDFVFSYLIMIAKPICIRLLTHSTGLVLLVQHLVFHPFHFCQTSYQSLTVLLSLFQRPPSLLSDPIWVSQILLSFFFTILHLQPG